MPTYCFICDDCGARWASETRFQAWDECRDCGQVTGVRRDWKAEGANVNLANCRAAR